MELWTAPPVVHENVDTIFHSILIFIVNSSFDSSANSIVNSFVNSVADRTVNSEMRVQPKWASKTDVQRMVTMDREGTEEGTQRRQRRVNRTTW